MPTLEERVAYMEGQVNEQLRAWTDTREAIRHLEAESREAIRHLEADTREAIRHLEQRLDTRFESLDDKVSRQFVWLVGIQVTTLIAIVGALLARA